MDAATSVAPTVPRVPQVALIPTSASVMPPIIHNMSFVLSIHIPRYLSFTTRRNVPRFLFEATFGIGSCGRSRVNTA